MHAVRDGTRTLQFDGTLLAQSTSEKTDSTRWVEFSLYKTLSGSYILERIGRSMLFHTKTCSVAARNSLKPLPYTALPEDALACELCIPDEDRLTDDEVYPERPRFFAQVSDSPHAVVEALMKYDGNGTRYLTRVAERLLEQAAQVDDEVRDAFLVEKID